MSEKSNIPYYNNVNDKAKYDFKKHKRKVFLNIIDDKSGATYNGKSFTDPLGMYTGVPEDPHEKPVQDVDDL